MPRRTERVTRPRIAGISYLEVMLTVAISALLMAGLMGVVNTATLTADDVGQRNLLAREARFAMREMVSNVARTRRLLLPLADNPATDWPEQIREQTVPPSPPIGSSTLATAVLAVTLPADIDLDADGIADADDDGDGALDEDLPGDAGNDGQPGIPGIDDNGDGDVDDSATAVPKRDDDEDDDMNEDSFDGIDGDNDGSIDEDPKGDNNFDGASGIIGVDDNGNGFIDEGAVRDDDEDGSTNEDWYNPVVFYLAGDVLTQRLPVPWDVNLDSNVDGLDYVTSDLAENVTLFRVERLPASGAGWQLVDITLELTHPESGERVSLQTRVRVGGAL